MTLSKELKKLLACSEEYITTPIKFMLQGKCTNGNLVSILQNKEIRTQFALVKGKKVAVSTLGSFEDGYCTCCEETLPVSSGSGSGSGGAGIGGGLVEAWANAKLFPTQTDNQFFCGGQFGGVKIVNYNGNLWLEFNYANFTSPNGIVQFFDNSNNQFATVGFIANGSGTILAAIVNLPQSQVGKIVISATTYTTSNNPLCTNGTVTFIP